MEDSKTYRWINLRVEDEVHKQLKRIAEKEYLPLATFAKKVLMEEIDRKEKSIPAESI